MRSKYLCAAFDVELQQFASVFPHLGQVELWISHDPCPWEGPCRKRNLAYSDLDATTIVLLHRALRLPDENILGIIRHELGHLADLEIDSPGREQRADDIAEYVTGERIYYDEDDIQTIAPGRYPRPLWLPR